MPRLGIRREDKNKWERRTPLTPRHVEKLAGEGVDVWVQPSPIRIFEDSAYERAGAVLSEDLSSCDVVLGVKEMPASFFREGGRYMFFSHTIKGQSYNMPMLAGLVELGCTLIDYEKIEDDSGRRLVFFGRYAGLAGMIETLWALGRRWEARGVRTPFVEIRRAWEYESLEDACEHIRSIGKRLADEGLPADAAPLVCGFAGYGNVSRGAQEIFDLLPVDTLEPGELLDGRDLRSDRAYKVVFKEEHTVRRRSDGGFDLQEFFSSPGLYESIFERYLPGLTILMNCVFWTPESPRLVTREWARRAWESGSRPKLEVIGDISCDIEGAVEFTLKATDIDSPVFVYDPLEDAAVDGFEHECGILVMAIDNLPCELAREASEDFGDALMPFMPALAAADFDREWSELELPAPLKRAVILHKGRFTPDFEYMREFLEGLRN